MKNIHEAEMHSEPFQTSKIEFFAKKKKTEADNYFCLKLFLKSFIGL